MASLTIKLRVDPTTGKKDILLDYHGEPGSLPFEHEQEHRAIVEKLLAAGILKAGEVGNIILEREQAAAPDATPATETPKTERQREKA